MKAAAIEVAALVGGGLVAYYLGTYIGTVVFESVHGVVDQQGFWSLIIKLGW